MNRRKLFAAAKASLVLLSTGLLLSTCTKKYAEINTDRNTIATVGAAELPFLFSKAEAFAIHDYWRYQVAQNLFSDQYAQYFACTATYFPSDRLNIRMDWVKWAFDPVYTDMMPQLQSIMAATSANSAENALANIVWVLGFHRITDYWGPIPYFKAGQPGNSIPYDPQDKIYDDFFKRLTAAVAALKANSTAQPFGTGDLIYGGNVAKWIKFANTLRLRLALRISKVDPTRAKTEAEAAVAGGVMTDSPADDALLQKSEKGSNFNGLSIMSDWNEFRMSASMESTLKGYSDPRMPVYFLPTENSAKAHAADPSKPLEYNGVRNGLTSTQLTEAINKPENNSHAGPRWASTAYPGGTSGYLSTPQNVMCTAEAYFLRAEGALLGWNMNGESKDLYEAGIANSMKQWGITDAAAIQAYINSTGTPIAPQDYLNSPPVSNIPVKFNTADINMQQQQIATQKWLALYPDGFEAWADYRRSRYLKLYPIANSENPDIPNPNVQWIRRIPFLDDEKGSNGQAVSDAVKLLNGPDKVTTPLWWDKN
jgi:hypothetical protein